MKNNDKWSALSMSERADLIKLYVSGGAMNLGEMRKHYNSFYEENEPNKYGWGGVGIDTSIPLESRENYLNKQRQSIIDDSLERSRTREKSTIPWILEYENEQSWRREIESQLEKNKQVYNAIKFNGNENTLKELQLEIEALNNELSNGYEEKLIPGAACIYTATDNYGKEYRVASNQEMYRNPEKYGFKRINPEKALPGDILQIDLAHAVTFDHLNEDGQVVFNQSKGVGEDVEVGRVAVSDGFSGFSNAYRFVGRDSDNKKWNNEYNQYRKDYGNKVLEELKQVPQLHTDKVRILNSAETEQTLSGKLNKFGPGGPIEVDEYGYPADITPAIVTQDDEFNKFLMTLPENQRQTPESKYYTYKMWRIAGKPKDFNQAVNMGLYHWHDSDKSYHGSSVIYDKESDVYHFLKPKDHSTIQRELDWYNKGVTTDGNGNQYELAGDSKAEWEDFRRNYYLDSSGDDYAYRRRPTLGVSDKARNGIMASLENGVKASLQNKLSSINQSLQESRVNKFGPGGTVETSGNNKEPIYMGELEPAVVKPNPMYAVLDTYYPITSKYPFTGHSELQLIDSGIKKPITITKYGDDYDYNLVTNNCSDATRCAVEQIFGEKINPILFTTPGDVQDFVAKKTGQEPFKKDVGQTSLGFEVPFATAMDLNNQDIDFYIQDYLHKASKFKKKQEKENPKWDSSSFNENVKKVVEYYENLKYKFQPFVDGYKIDESGNYVKANGGKLNTFGEGGDSTNPEKLIWERAYGDLPKSFKQAILKVARELNYEDKDVEKAYNSGELKAALDAVFKHAPYARVRNNDSPTSEESSKREDKMNSLVYNKPNERVSPNMKFAIPYIEDLEIKIPGVGRTTTNALDSLAKYAFEAKIPLEEALGLGAQETALGALPFYNYVEIPKNGTEEEKQKARDHNRALGNSSYFRNYGIIPAENLVRDFRYNIVEDPISRDVPPLLHAFNYWKEGMYNRGDKNHTSDVRERGREVMSTKPIQEWIKDSKYAQKAINLFK